eukprot:540239-Alexandrium_andersonii.AAC.1
MCHRRNLKDTPQRPPHRTTVLKPQAHLGQQGPSQGLRRPEVLGQTPKKGFATPWLASNLRAPVWCRPAAGTCQAMHVLGYPLDCLSQPPSKALPGPT